MVLIFALLYGIFAIFVVWLASNLKFGEVCTWLVLIPISGLIFGDWVLEKVNKYFAEKLRKPLSQRINFDLYMAILNAFMYLSIYTAGALWVYRLSGNFLFVPLIMLIGMLFGAHTIKKVYG